MLRAATDTLASYGGWLGSLAGFHATPTSVSSATDMAAAMRNTALSNLTGVLVGLMGSVIGGWIASGEPMTDRKSTRLNSSHRTISYAVFCLKKKKNTVL